MAEPEKIILELTKPKYTIGQDIFVPRKNHVTDTKINGYEVQVIEDAGKLVGVITNYRLQHLVDLRRGDKHNLVYLVKECDFYLERGRAEAASKFIPVAAEDETWRLAVGDRNVNDEASPYFIGNCGLPNCCANISDARDLLYLCKAENGLIVHERELLAELLTGHRFEYEHRSPIGVILGQLGI